MGARQSLNNLSSNSKKIEMDEHAYEWEDPLTKEILEEDNTFLTRERGDGPTKG